MRNISQLVASLMLLATQANITASGNAAAASDQSSTATSALEVKLNTNTADPIVIDGPIQPSYDSAVLNPLHAAEAAAAAQKAAAQAAANAAAAKAAASRVVRVISVVTAVPFAGSHTDWMRAAGIADSDFGYVNYIIDHESGWGVTKSNYSGSGAYGLGQALPASKMAPYGADYLTDPITQLRWATSYAVGRYGSWAGAYSHWISHHSW